MESELFEQYSCQANTAKFNGRYIIIAPKNYNYINLKLPNGIVENYYWSIPQTAIHNLLIGKMYVDVRGKTRITNHTLGEVCDIEWKERTWSGKNAYCYEGIVKNA
jgi:oxysterol-binding protein 1